MESMERKVYGPRSEALEAVPQVLRLLAERSVDAQKNFWLNLPPSSLANPRQVAVRLPLSRWCERYLSGPGGVQIRGAGITLLSGVF